MNRLLVLRLPLLAILLCGCDLHRQKGGDSEQAAASGPDASLFFQGQSIESVQQILGEPNGIVTSGARTILLYGREILEFIDGKWINSDPDIRRKIEDGRKALAEQAAVQADLAKKREKELARQAETQADLAKKKKSAKTQAEPARIGKGSAAVPVAKEYSGLLTPGKITVVDFYATWCGPCKQMAPLLDNMVRGKSDVTLRKVDIGNWDSSVAKKYNITSVPNVRVFDKNGRMVGSPTSDPNQVARNIEQARKN